MEEALARLQLKSPGRHNSYSDSTDGDEEVEKAFTTAEHSMQNWDRSVYQTPSSNSELGRYDSSGQLDGSFHSAFYSPNLSKTRLDLSNRYLTSRSIRQLCMIPILWEISNCCTYKNIDLLILISTNSSLF